jgi:deoxyribonuclease-4
MKSLIDEIKRCEVLGIPYLVLHPGSHLGSGEGSGI